MSFTLSPFGGVGAQFFDNNGDVLTGGKLYTYAAGTTTPQATYTTSAGNVAHTNPIILDAAGRVPTGEMWLANATVYKFVLTTSTNVLIGTYDNVSGINSNYSNAASSISYIPNATITGTNVQTALDQVATILAAPSTQPKLNYNWMGFFGTWQNGYALKTDTGARQIGASGATFARLNFIDDNVSIYAINGTYQPNGVRVQRNNANIKTESATVVMNLTQAETKPLLGKNICAQIHALKSATWSGANFNVRLQYSKEPQQPIVLANGEYTNGHTVLASSNFTLATTMPAESAPFSVTGLLPDDAVQVAIVITIPWSGSAGTDDYVDFEGCFLTVGTAPATVEVETFDALLVKAKTRYQTTYAYSASRGAISKAGALRVVAINTSTTSATIASVRFDPSMAVTPQVLMQSPLSGTENRWENETTGVFVNGLPYNLNDQGVTLQNNGAVTAGDVLLCHWTARCVF